MNKLMAYAVSTGMLTRYAEIVVTNFQLTISSACLCWLALSL